MNLSYKIAIFSTIESCVISPFIFTVDENISMFVDEYYYMLSSITVATYCKKDISLIEKYSTNFNWRYFSGRKDITENLLLMYCHKLDWNIVSLNNANLTLRAVNKFRYLINFSSLSSNPNLNYNVATSKEYRKFIVPSNFDLKNLNEKIATAFIRHIDINKYVTINRKVSREFMLKHIYRMSKENRDSFLKSSKLYE